MPWLRRPAAWSLAVGALSLPALVVGAAGLSPDSAYRVAVGVEVVAHDPDAHASL